MRAIRYKRGLTRQCLLSQIPTNSQASRAGVVADNEIGRYHSDFPRQRVALAVRKRDSALARERGERRPSHCEVTSSEFGRQDASLRIDRNSVAYLDPA